MAELWAVFFEEKTLTSREVDIQVELSSSKTNLGDITPYDSFRCTVPITVFL